MRYAVRPLECGEHSKKPTKHSRTEQTKIMSDGQVAGYEPDTEEWVEMDEE
jgi:hypothetical protein